MLYCRKISHESKAEQDHKEQRGLRRTPEHDHLDRRLHGEILGWTSRREHNDLRQRYVHVSADLFIAHHAKRQLCKRQKSSSENTWTK
jgi:hypothetical protein